jgi:hypothetical protein
MVARAHKKSFLASWHPLSFPNINRNTVPLILEFSIDRRNIAGYETLSQFSKETALRIETA